MEARYYSPKDEGVVECKLCPHNCIIVPGHKGICKIRTNINGTLEADMYGLLSATHIDPIEKKPLYHFSPGSEILSLGSLGCNFRCTCCQNYEISQTGKEGFPRLQIFSVNDIVKTAKTVHSNIGVAYTYNEPTIWFEYMIDIAKSIREAGLKNVVVSNGYLNTEPLAELLNFIDAFNIDLKCFDEKKHRQFTGGELHHVLETLKGIVAVGKHLEITLLLIPGMNDDQVSFGRMINWIDKHLGSEIPLHISRYFPHYKMTTEATVVKDIVEKVSFAGRYLHYVYAGNIPGNMHQDTVCPGCGEIVIKRRGYSVDREKMNNNGACVNCGYKISYT
jgi:pyruvate formate lyase activating enzyme